MEKPYDKAALLALLDEPYPTRDELLTSVCAVLKVLVAHLPAPAPTPHSAPAPSRSRAPKEA
jgi:hypothetical protein